jgi:hypothetical protein
MACWRGVVDRFLDCGFSANRMSSAIKTSRPFASNGSRPVIVARSNFRVLRQCHTKTGSESGQSTRKM